MSKHTPGPWMVAGWGDEWTIETNPVSAGALATVWVEEANARLIAAAPELLYELEASQDALCWAWCRRDLDDHTEHCKAARAVIAKAKGE